MTLIMAIVMGMTMIYPEKMIIPSACDVSYKVGMSLIFIVFSSVTISFFRNILCQQHRIKVLSVSTSWVGRTSVTK